MPDESKTRAPNLKVPPGACDTHMHIYNNAYPASSKAWLFPPNFSVDDYRKVQARLGLQRMIIVQPVTYGFDNSCTLDSAAMFGDDARTVVTVPTDVADSELERLWRRGARGLRYHQMRGSVTEWSDVPVMAERIRGTGWHLQIQFDGLEFPDHEALLARLPCTFVIDHMGRYARPLPLEHNAIRSLLRIAARENVYVKLSGAYHIAHGSGPDYREVAPLAQALIAQGADRLLWDRTGRIRPRRPRPCLTTPICSICCWAGHPIRMPARPSSRAIPPVFISSDRRTMAPTRNVPRSPTLQPAKKPGSGSSDQERCIVRLSDILRVRRADRFIKLMEGPVRPDATHRARCNMLSRVTLDQLQILIAVADTGNFSAAARKINRVQSAVSQSIQSLEDGLELKLFDRSSKVPRLTDAGRAIVQDARRIISGADALRARAKNMASVAEPEISLSIEQVFPSTVLIESLRAFRERFPLVSVNLFAEGLGAPEQSLFEGNARLAIYSTSRDGMPGFQMEFLGDVPISAVASSHHPLAKVDGLISQSTLEEHIQLTMVDRTKRYRGVVMGTHTWSFIDQFSRLDFLLNGFGWCTMPTHLAQSYLDTGELVELKLAAHNGEPLWFPLYAVHKVEQPPGPAAQWLLSEMRRRFSEWIAATVGDQSLRRGIQIRVTTV